jgi:putative transposase
MRTYTRARIPGATYFFTVNLAERRGNDLLLRHIRALRESFRITRQEHPFIVHAAVVLPEHLHCLWSLPAGDHDFATRWRLIKARFSRAIPPREQISSSRRRKGERGIWQRRYWEHVIRNEEDLRRRLDYIHFNPIKHGYVTRAADWPYSSFHRHVRLGLYPHDWAVAIDLVSAGE